MDASSYTSSSSDVHQAESSVSQAATKLSAEEHSDKKLDVRRHGGHRPPNPKKRQRTTFTQSQLRVLEDAFARQQYLVGSERLRLATILNIGVAQVKVWFQNRRIRWRREQRRLLLSLSSQTMSSFTSTTTSLATSLTFNSPLQHKEEVPTS